MRQFSTHFPSLLPSDRGGGDATAQTETTTLTNTEFTPYGTSGPGIGVAVGSARPSSIRILPSAGPTKAHCEIVTWRRPALLLRAPSNRTARSSQVTVTPRLRYFPLTLTLCEGVRSGSTFGEIARFTGVSRRMLRHWEEAGLIAPASVDEYTGYRRYSRTQVGRVRAISALRSVGFALAEIVDLLDHSRLTEGRLVELLRAREQELATQIDEASARLAEVRKRLDAIQRGHDTIMSTIELGALPALRLSSLQATVSDESEIGEAIAGLLPRLRDELGSRGITDSNIVLAYDGAADESLITVTAGTAAIDDASGASEMAIVEVSGADRGVTVRFDVPPSDIGDAWISLDTSLEAYDLETTGVYRQILTPQGGVILQAPVKEQSAAC